MVLWALDCLPLPCIAAMTDPRMPRFLPYQRDLSSEGCWMRVSGFWEEYAFLCWILVNYCMLCKLFLTVYIKTTVEAQTMTANSLHLHVTSQTSWKKKKKLSHKAAFPPSVWFSRQQLSDSLCARMFWFISISLPNRLESIIIRVS